MVQVEQGLLERLEFGDLFSIAPDELHVLSLQVFQIVDVTHLILLADADGKRGRHELSLLDRHTLGMIYPPTEVSHVQGKAGCHTGLRSGG